ncbi:mucin-2-like [Dorcoceras hygrometricum]|uniref:Mucin-2-like n=1 Tax=Dorcoceras hygrometricum TaxID=472368 RepID=A0A2Z7AHP0_9LAMI|nr:mucin-2-like [Dorcoceras hygrometricum]
MNQQRRNQLEHDEPAETMNQLQALKRKDEPAGTRNKKLAEESYRRRRCEKILLTNLLAVAIISTVDESINSRHSRSYEESKAGAEATKKISWSFFANAIFIGGEITSTISKQKLVITQEIFAETFHLPTEGLVIFSGKAVADMKVLFSATTVSFKSSSKKKEMKVECRLLNDIVAKLMTNKASSFDAMRAGRFEMMVAISARLKLKLLGVHLERGSVSGCRQKLCASNSSAGTFLQRKKGRRSIFRSELP